MDGMATDDVGMATSSRITLVCGPPGAGKAEYVRRLRKTGDLIVDTDSLFSALSGQPRYDQPANLVPFVAEARDIILARLERDPSVTAWLIGAGATRGARRRVSLPLSARVIVLATPPAACEHRILADRNRSHLYATLKPQILRWWQDYEPNETDLVVDMLA